MANTTNCWLFEREAPKKSLSRADEEYMSRIAEKRHKTEDRLDEIALRKECDYFDEILREFGFYGSVRSEN